MIFATKHLTTPTFTFTKRINAASSSSSNNIININSARFLSRFRSNPYSYKLHYNFNNKNIIGSLHPLSQEQDPRRNQHDVNYTYSPTLSKTLLDVRHISTFARSASVSAVTTTTTTTRLKSTVSGGGDHGRDHRRNDDSVGSNDNDNETENLQNNHTNATTTKTNQKEKFQHAAKKGSNAMRKGAFTIRDMVKKYGWTFIGTYFTIYIATLASLYGGLDSGLIDPSTLTNIEVPWHASGGDGGGESGGGSGSGSGGTSDTDREDFNSAVEFVASYMKKYSWTAPYADEVMQRPRLSNLAIAWVATKLTEPIRLAVSLAIARTLKKD